MRVHVANSVLAFSTVRCTVLIFSLAFVKLAVTPSITRLTSRTRSSSAFKRASRASDWLRARCSGCCFCALEALEVGVCFCVVAPLSGLANRSSLSSSRRSFAMSGVSVDFDIVVACARPIQICYVQYVSFPMLINRPRFGGLACLRWLHTDVSLFGRLQAGDAIPHKPRSCPCSAEGRSPSRNFPVRNPSPATSSPISTISALRYHTPCICRTRHYVSHETWIS